MDLVLEILKLIIPTAIALASLVYAAKQRNMVKNEISKKRYLESAQSNLNEAISDLKSIAADSMSDLNCDLDEALGPDNRVNVDAIVNDVLKASFETTKKRMTLSVSYELTDCGARTKPYSEKEPEKITDFSNLSSKLLIDLIKSDRTFWIQSTTVIPHFERRLANEIEFDVSSWGLVNLWRVICRLSKFEEVYDTVCPNIVKRANQLLEITAEEIFKVISESKKVEVDLEKFSKTDDLAKYLVETFLNYSHIYGNFSKGISDLIHSLTEARKELFLRLP